MERTIIYAILFLSSIFINSLCANENIENEVPVEDVKSVYKSAKPSGFTLLAETFDNEEDFKTSWILSKAKKNDIDEDIAKYDGVWSLEEPKKHAQSGDSGLVLKSKAKHAAISATLTKPFYFKDDPLIVQYEVNFQDGQECGGAYLKLLTMDSQHKNLDEFHDKTPYTIMFGPDKCGNVHQLHFIFRHKNPLNGTIEEKHARKPKERLEDFFKDKQPHLYTLIVRPDNTFEIKIDNKIVNSGSLLDDFNPAVNPPLEIEDPNDTQPEDWDDNEKIPDPLAVKPEDWDENAPAQIIDEDDVMPVGWLEDESDMLPDTNAEKPADWDVEIDEEWEPPLVKNPKCVDAPGCGPYKQRMKRNPQYKGKWLAPLIDNPNYKGKWKPKLIHNPNYFNDEHPFEMLPVFALGFELWSMSADILFDNIIITNDESVAQKWAEDSFEVKRVKIAEESATLWGRLMNSLNHKPGYWALYFSYCSIPIFMYIWYLVKQYREWSVWRQIATFTTQHPWIWAVYILGVGLPVILLVYCCCFSSQDKEDKKDEEKLIPDVEEEKLLPDIDEEKSNLDADDEKKEKDEDESKETSPSEEETENNDVAEETIESESDKEKLQSGGDGPRRRKPNQG